MGRYPFVTYANRYIEAIKMIRSPITIGEMRRRYRNIYDDLEYLHKKGLIKSTNPEKLTAEDIVAYVNLVRAGEGPGRRGSGKPLKPKSIYNNLGIINDLCMFACGRGVVDEAKKKYPAYLPKIYAPRHPPLKSNEFITIIKYANEVKDDDWKRMVAYAMTLIAMSAGLRNKELRMADIGDLDLDNGTIYTDDVKGQDTYGQTRTAPIHPTAIPFLRRYVVARERILVKRKLNTTVLFPSIIAGSHKPDLRYTADGTRLLRKIVIEDTEIEYDLRKCRRTYGQILKNEGISIEAISVCMGHATTKTTERSYARLTEENAIAEAQKIWQMFDSSNTSNKPPITSETSVSGSIPHKHPQIEIKK